MNWRNDYLENQELIRKLSSSGHKVGNNTVCERCGVKFKIKWNTNYDGNYPDKVLVYARMGNNHWELKSVEMTCDEYLIRDIIQ